MNRNLNPLTSLATGAIAWLCLLIWIFGMAGHCMAADSILPDIPRIDWRDLKQGRLIGRGGFGDVYEGQWKGQEVAIKTLHMHVLPNAAVKQDFEAEVRVMWSSSQYPRILRLYGVTEASNCAMVMERMQRSLHDLIHSGEEIPDAKRLQIAIDIAQGLKSLHDQKIVHRDLKSQNILLDKRDRGKISDFGFAKTRGHTQSATKLGGTSGTARWSAPEVFGANPQATPASDMYSYGMILWEILTRKVPFAKQPSDIMALTAVRGGAREEIPEGCHPVWREVIKGCWEQDPGKRPTASDVLARFMPLMHPHRPLWLPEEDPGNPLRAEGYVRQLASPGDWDVVLRSYAPHPVPGYDVGRVDQNIEALKKKLEQSQSAEQQAGERIRDLAARLEQSQREAGQYIQSIEELKRQLAASQEENRVLRSKALEADRLAEDVKRLEKKEEKRPVAMIPAIPFAAQGHEAIYKRFLNGALIYTDPQTRNKITLPIRDFPNPLKGTFDLSRCGDTGHYLSISTGYRQEKKPENARKTEIWLAPRFLIEKELNGTAAHFKPIMDGWNQDAPVGIFWTSGNWDDKNWYDYLTNESIDNLSKIGLCKNWKKSRKLGLCIWQPTRVADSFQVLFMN